MDELPPGVGDILRKEWPKVAATYTECQEELARRKLGDLSRRFNNEARDALDHLCRAALANSEEEQTRNITATREHLRRANVESLENLVETELLKIRPVPISLDYLGLKNVSSLLRSWRVWAELLKKFLLVHPMYDQLAMDKIYHGKSCLLAARRAKGLNTEDVIHNLNSALAAFKAASEHMQANALGRRVFALLLAIFAVVLGLVGTWLLKHHS